MNHKFEKRVKRIYAMLSCFVLVAVMTVCPAFAADDPLAVVTNLSDFIFSLIRAIGLILLPIMIYHPLQLIVCSIMAENYANQLRLEAAVAPEGNPVIAR